MDYVFFEGYVFALSAWEKRSYPFHVYIHYFLLVLDLLETKGNSFSSIIPS